MNWVDLLSLPIMLATLASMIALVWHRFCVYRTNKAFDAIPWKSLPQIPACIWKNEEDTIFNSRERYCWRLMTLRNPRKIYGPLMFSLFREFVIDQEFLDYYQYVYLTQPPDIRAGVLSYMRGWITNPSLNPMVIILCQFYEMRLEDYKTVEPSEIIDQGAQEYEDAMEAQRAMDMIDGI